MIHFYLYLQFKKFRNVYLLELAFFTNLLFPFAQEVRGETMGRTVHYFACIIYCYTCEGWITDILCLLSWEVVLDGWDYRHQDVVQLVNQEVIGKVWDERQHGNGVDFPWYRQIVTWPTLRSGIACSLGTRGRTGSDLHWSTWERRTSPGCARSGTYWWWTGDCYERWLKWDVDPDSRNP